MHRLLLALLLLPTAMFAQLSLVPQPASVQRTDGALALNTGLTITTPAYKDARLERAIHRAMVRMDARTTMILERDTATPLVIDVKARGNDIPQLGDDESYSLVVTPARAELTANTVVGAIRGLETLVQLVTPTESGYVLPAVTIHDKPRFAWRGLHIDVSRHFEPVEVIKRNIDALAAVKMNVFHWHLTDDQGFRIESKVFPKLAGMGSDGEYYTQEQVKDVIAYAADRGVRVLPEFDMPGHATSWMVGYPQLASAPGPYQIERRFGVFDPTMDPTKDSTYKFLDKFIGEMARLFPDAYFHIGGDENNGKQWKANPKIQAFMKRHHFETTAQLQTYFNTRLLAIVKKYHKHMVGWDEILTPTLPKDIVVQSWRGLKSLDEGARAGYQGILSQPYYFDAMMTAEQLYLADPVPANTTLTPEERARILGGESCMWAEETTPQNIERDIWPRNLAVAERFWSPQNVTDVNDFYRRMNAVSVQLEYFGLQHLASQERALRALVGSPEIPAPVQLLVNNVEPYRLGIRHRLFEIRQTQQTPLTSLADTVNVDPPSRRTVELAVEQLLAGAPNFQANTAELSGLFTELANLDKSYALAAVGNPALAKAVPRAQDIAELSRAGLEELEIVRDNKPVDDAWLAEKLALFDRCEKPTAALRIAWLPAMRTLTYIAAYRSKAGEMTPEAWREKVVTDSAPPKPQRH